MARKFLVPIDHSNLELLNARLQNLASAPSSPAAGWVYYDTVLGATYVYDGTAWISQDARKLSGAIPIAALAADPRARATHTGTQTASTISDFATTTLAFRLDQFAAPTAAVSFNGQKGTNLATPTAAGDAAEYSWVIGQVQSAAAGIASKPPARLVTTANTTLSGLSAIDGVTPVDGDRILVTGQTTASQNGIYNAHSGAWTRTTIDGPAPGEIEAGAMWLVTEGTVGTATQWRVSTTGTITIGTTSIAIPQFGAGGTYTNGFGLNLSGGSFSIKLATSSGLIVDSTGLYIDPANSSKKFVATIGDGSATSITVNHALGTRDVNVQVYQNGSSYATVECDVNRTDANNVAVVFTTAPASNAYRVVVMA